MSLCRRPWLTVAHQSTDFADLTVKCGETELRVHRVVLCSQSPFFKAACVNDCQESRTATIEFPDDEPQIIERLIEFCYRADYAEFPASPFFGHVKVFAAATKYGLPDVAHEATLKYYDLAACDDWNISEFLLSVPYIYESTHESVVAMRTTASECAQSRMKSLTKTQERYDAWRRTCLDVPEFAFDVLHQVAKESVRFICQACHDQTPLVRKRIKSGCCKADVESDPEVTAISPRE